MDDFEESYNSALDAGQRNLKTTTLLGNWCVHAQVERSGGRGMIEAATGLPIGHMGVQCNFARKTSMHSWLLEDAAYSFYQSNCKNCSERIPVGLPNILEFVLPREEAAKKRREAREEEAKRREEARSDRQLRRAQLRSQLSLEETWVLDLLEELDQEDVSTSDPKLEQLANLAPEAFTRKVIDLLLPTVLHERLPYSMPAAKALLRTPLIKADEKLSVAVRLVSNFGKPPIF